MSDERDEIIEEEEDLDELDDELDDEDDDEDYDEKKGSWIKSFMKRFFRTKAGGITALVLIGAIILSAIGIALYEPQQTLDTTYIIARLEKSSELTTAKLHYKGFSIFKDEGITFINKGNFKMVYEATARVGIDVKEIKVDVDNVTRTVWLTIPKAKILDVKVDSNTIKYYDEKFALFNFDKKEDANKATSLAEKEAVEEIGKMGVLEMADQQAEALIKGLIQDLVPKKYEMKVK